MHYYYYAWTILLSLRLHGAIAIAPVDACMYVCILYQSRLFKGGLRRTWDLRRRTEIIQYQLKIPTPEYNRRLWPPATAGTS
jgi:hypothetical protein